MYKRILTKLDVQLDRVESGAVQIHSLNEEFKDDWFEQLARFGKNVLRSHPDVDEKLTERYMYYRAQEIISRKVIKEFKKLEYHPAFASEKYDALLEKVIQSYQAFYRDASDRKEALVSEQPAFFVAIEERFGRDSLHKAFAEGLQQLTRKNMLPTKLAILLEEDFPAQGH